MGSHSPESQGKLEAEPDLRPICLWALGEAQVCHFQSSPFLAVGVGDAEPHPEVSHDNSCVPFK